MKRLTSKRKIFTVTAVAAVFVAAVVFTIVFTFQMTNVLQKCAKGIIRPHTRAIAKMTDQYIKSDMQALDYFCGEAKDMPSTLNAQYLKIFAQQNGFSYIVYIDENGIAHNSFDTKMNVYPFEEYTKLLKAKEKSVSKVFYDKLTGENVVAVSSFYYDADGNKKVVCGMHEIKSRVESALLFYHGLGETYIITTDGDIIKTPADDEEIDETGNLYQYIGHHNDPDSIVALTNSIKAGETNFARMEYKGEKCYIRYEPVNESLDWYVISFLPEHGFNQEINSLFISIIIISFLVIVVLAAIVIVYLRSVNQLDNTLQTITYIDGVTGKSNFGKFKTDAQALLDSSAEREVAVFYSDVINFKYINDIFGYETGDKLLKYISDVLEETVKDYGGLFARISSDTFVWLAKCEGQENQRAMVADITEKINQFEETKANNYKIEICTGILCAKVLDKNLNINELLDRANLAQKSIKKKGNPQYCAFYDEELRAVIKHEKEIESRMHEALKNGEFIIYLQPKYNVHSGKVKSAEALVRWDCPGKGIIPPMEFIPLFERNRFIIDLDQYVFETVCKYLRQWLDMGQRAVPISINVSRVQLYSSDFVERYVNIKNKYYIPDGYLEIEFTESIIFENLARLRQVVDELQANGFRCSLDDFGKGYSSLSMLKDVEIDVLKLDRAFFCNGISTYRDKAVIKNVVSMAKSLNMLTVSEGVETEDQVNFLRTVDCDMVQGYVYSRPIPVMEFELLLLKPDNVEND